MAKTMTGSDLFNRRTIIWALIVFIIFLFTYAAYEASQNRFRFISSIYYGSSSDYGVPSGLVISHAPLPAFENRSWISCTNKDPAFSYTQKGIFIVMNNYIPAGRYFKCDESVTYTTHGDITFLDNIPQVIARWEGPLSMALYTPGSDYLLALEGINYLRKCSDPAIRERVTFHFVLDTRHLPESILPLHENQGMDPSTRHQTAAEVPEVNCSKPAPWESLSKDHVTYKLSKNLTYPINVLRNVARDNAQTYYVLASDVELYPSLKLATKFLQMLRRTDSILNSRKPKVFVLPVFEVKQDESIPDSKYNLVSKLKEGKAIPFHRDICSPCHAVPGIEGWISGEIKEELSIFQVTKRHKPHEMWEPFYIGTVQDPHFDDRLTWEGQKDKMTQAYSLCLLDYDFVILDNAFFVHRPGIKKHKKDPARDSYIHSQNELIANTITKELKLLYGDRPECYL